MGIRLKTRSFDRLRDQTDRDAEELAIARRAIFDRAAFEPLYDRYLNPILTHCHRRLGSREAAEDACAATFRKALERLESFHYGSFRAWLFVIADNTLRDLARTTHPASPLDEGGDWPDSARGPEEVAVLAEERARLRAALALLSPESRQVVLLRLDGLSCLQVAQAMTPPRTEAAVRQIHRRALLRLRELLGDRSATGAER
jgi:RNA polymerase sigma-70 factor (ECF subfamily)